ncbi:MAG: ABC transporter permease [Lachnospiraceae bacterium]|jgi:cell division transport system permease protein|nr:permease-like cell division protein FtsX [uncultured Acetatifactor sp.]MCI8799933.1 ABC transporter permease [Lachnospiraceae bacterium]
MKISTLFYTIKQGFVNIFRNKWYSLASIATIAACLFLFGLFYSVVANFRSIVMKAEEGVSVTVFFHSEWDQCEKLGKPHEEGMLPTDERIEEIGQMIANRAEVSDVKFVSDDEAWENFTKERFGEEFQAYSLGFLENPLKGDHSYEIFLSDVSLQNALVTWLESFPEVSRVNYSALTADTLSGANLLIAYVSLGIIVILLAVSIFLISNTVAIGISVRSEEINIMKYIGATDFFVRSPFVLEGMLIGLLGAMLPLGLIYSIYNYALNYIAERFSILSNFLNFLPAEEIFHVLTPVSMGVGVGIGFLGSITTVRKHLRV